MVTAARSPAIATVRTKASVLAAQVPRLVSVDVLRGLVMVVIQRHDAVVNPLISHLKKYLNWRRLHFKKHLISGSLLLGSVEASSERRQYEYELDD